jgi:glycine cleavage system T protein
MRTILYDIQRDQGANFGDFQGWEKPVDFGDCLAEHRAVREAMGLLDRSERGKLVLTGGDRVTWLQGMVSNDVRPLAEGASYVCAGLLNATGHLLADVRIINRGDSLLLDLDRQNAEKILRLLDGFIITEDVEVVDQSDFLACLSVQGPGEQEAWVRRHVGEDAFVTEADHTGSGGFDIYIKSKEALTLWRRLVEAGAHPVGEAAADTLRIEAGIPVYGVDMDETTIPLEANLESTHVSHTKGCYVGQEIIARIHSRGHTNRALTGLILHESQLPHKGDRIYPTEGETTKEIGWVTSSTHSPSLEKAIALCYLRHEFREPGTRVRIARQDDIVSASVTALPFVKPRAGQSAAA